VQRRDLHCGGERCRGSAAAARVRLAIFAAADAGLYCLDGQTELLRDDPRRVGAAPRAEVLGPDLDRDGAVRLDGDVHLTLGVPAAPPRRAAAAHAALERLVGTVGGSAAGGLGTPLPAK